MSEQKHLMRSNNAMIAGVCAGIAEYFSIDPTLVRVIAVVLLLIGCGSPILVYLIMMIVMPKAPADYTAYVDVNPVETPKRQTDASGRVKGAPVPPPGAYVPPVSSQAGQTQAAAQGYQPPRSQYAQPANAGGAAWATGTGTVPSATQTAQMPHATQATQPVDSAAYAAPAAQAGPQAQSAQASNPGAAYSAAYGVAYDADGNATAKKKTAWYNWPIFFIGLLLIGIGVSAIVGRFIPGIEWWSFWPLILIVCGFIIMVTRGDAKHWSVVRLFEGLFIIAVGIILLGCTTDVIGWHVLEAIFDLWPLFIVGVGVLILSSALHSKIVQCLGLVVFVAGLVLGTFNYCYHTDYLNTPLTLSNYLHEIPVSLVIDGAWDDAPYALLQDGQ